MLKRLTLSALGLTFSTLTMAYADQTNIMVPDSGFFGGIGASYSSTNINQGLYASGVSNVYEGGSQVASGEAGGPAAPYNATTNNLAPLIQLGYFQHFNNSDWLWGGKLFYQYTDSSVTNQSVDVPQSGFFDGSTAFTGNVIVGSLQTTLKNELALIPFIGRSFGNGYFYFGAGPALFNVQSQINNAIGFADINGVHADITGARSSFSDNNWVWGAATQLGMTYFFDPTFFLDVNYTYAYLGNFTVNNSAPFSSTTTSGGDTYTTTGTLFANPTTRISSQAIMLSINKVF